MSYKQQQVKVTDLMKHEVFKSYLIHIKHTVKKTHYSVEQWIVSLRSDREITGSISGELPV